MAREIEIKLAIKDKKQLERILKICKSKTTGDNPEIFQRDEYFDYRDDAPEVRVY